MLNPPARATTRLLEVSEVNRFLCLAWCKRSIDLFSGWELDGGGASGVSGVLNDFLQVLLYLLHPAENPSVDKHHGHFVPGIFALPFEVDQQLVVLHVLDV